MFQLKVKRTLKQNLKKGPVRGLEVSITEPADEAQDKATHDADKSSSSLPRNVDDARQITDRLLARTTWDDEQFHVPLLLLFQTLDSQPADVRIADRWSYAPVAWIVFITLRVENCFTPEGDCFLLCQ